jgi:hypothetical protein
MFRATFCPSSGAFLNWQPQPLVPVQNPYKTMVLYGNRGLQLQFKRAPDDGQNVARNMLSNVYTIKDFTAECASGWLI